MEGNIIVGAILKGYLAQKNKSLENGCSAKDMQKFITMLCSMSISTESAELCAYFIMKEYKIDEAKDDLDRVMRFAEFGSENLICKIALPFNLSLMVTSFTAALRFNPASQFEFHQFITLYVLPIFSFSISSGELNFNEDQVRLLTAHSSGEKSTYGYQFMPYVSPPKENLMWHVPEKLKTTSDHADELPYVFGVPRMTETMFEPYNGEWVEISSISDRNN